MSFKCQDIAESTFFTTNIRFLHVQCTSIDVFILFLILAFILTGIRIYLGNELSQEKRNMQLNIIKYDTDGKTRKQWNQSFTRFMMLEFAANIAWMIYVLLIITVNFWTLITLLTSYMFFNYIYFKYDLLGFDASPNGFRVLMNSGTPDEGNSKNRIYEINN